MMRSLYSGVSGLRTHQTRMDVIGNNIANVNTTAYKAKSINFSDMLYQTTVTYASGELNTLVQWVAKMKSYGVEFQSVDTETSKTTSLDDILDSFNTKMNAIIDKLNLLTASTDQESEAESGTV